MLSSAGADSHPVRFYFAISSGAVEVFTFLQRLYTWEVQGCAEVSSGCLRIRRTFEIFEFRTLERLEFRIFGIFGILEFQSFRRVWNFQALEPWSFGILEHRSFGTLELWSFGILEHGSFRISEFWNFEIWRYWE